MFTYGSLSRMIILDEVFQWHAQQMRACEGSCVKCISNHATPSYTAKYDDSAMDTVLGPCES